jgi:hypothetical protein
LLKNAMLPLNMIILLYSQLTNPGKSWLDTTNHTY